MKKLWYFSFFVCLFFLAEDLQSQETGLANLFNSEFQGSFTASDEAYDKSLMTAAHKSYEFGTILNVTNLDNGKKVKVRVIDRGPFVAGYVVTLSEAAASALSISGEKSRVTISISRNQHLGGEPDEVVITNIETGEIAPAKKVISKKPINTVVQAPASQPTVVKETKVYREPIQEVTTTSQEFVSKGKEAYEDLNNRNYSQYDLYSITLKKPKKAGYGLQVGTFSSYENAIKEIAKMQGFGFDNVLMSMEKSKDGKSTAYKIILGPFYSKKASSEFNAKLLKSKGIASFTIDLGTIVY